MQNINNFARICIFCIIIVPLQRICISMVEESMYIPEFEQYIRATEPDVRERADIWRTAIGLQQVDRLTVSDFLKKTAERNIIGEISIDQAGDIVRTYYQSKENRLPDEEDKEEADKVATNIARILGQESFTYSIAGLAAVHKQIFADVFKHAGQFRQYDITKKEWVLNGETVLYTHYENIRITLEYDLEQERQFDYGSLSITDAIEHIAKFVSGLWQIHPFAEGNTRTTAIFTIKYLRSMGFSQINNELFEKHSWYFRNALVRANYRNLEKNINPDCAFLVLFLRNLLLGEQNELHNRTLHVDWNRKRTSPPTSPPTSTPTTLHVDIHSPQSLFYTDNDKVKRVIISLGRNKLSVKEIMVVCGLRDRKNFIEYSLNPAISEGFVRMLYPDSPRHPKQKYLLTVKGLGWYDENYKNNII